MSDMTDSITARPADKQDTGDVTPVLANLWENYFASDTALTEARNQQEFYNLGATDVFGSVPVATAPDNLGEALDDHKAARGQLGAFYGRHGTRATRALMRYLAARTKRDEFGLSERQLRIAQTELDEATTELAEITHQIKQAIIAGARASD
jgi:hypothetical protein